MDGFCKIKVILGLAGVVACALGGCGAPETTYAEARMEQSTLYAENSAESGDAAYESRFQIYGQYGMTYDAEENKLYYDGKPVRWFEDYYSLGEGMQAGTDFFNETGVVDVYAVRDLDSVVKNEDGSLDPGGRLVGLEEFSAQEFAARDIEALKNPQKEITCVSGGELTPEEMQAMAKEYEPFGVTYNAHEKQWYYNDEKVRIFQDVLTSNGEALTGGRFKGVIRTYASEEGMIEVHTIRDYENVNASGEGKLLGVEKSDWQEQN